MGRLLCGFGLLFWSPLIGFINAPRSETEGRLPVMIKSFFFFLRRVRGCVAEVISSVQTLEMKLPPEWFRYLQEHFSLARD